MIVNDSKVVKNVFEKAYFYSNMITKYSDSTSDTSKELVGKSELIFDELISIINSSGLEEEWTSYKSEKSMASEVLEKVASDFSR